MMNDQLIVGLTGGIGSGKTTVSQYLMTKYHIEIIDADKIARRVVDANHAVGQKVLAQLQETFGAWILDEKGAYHRAGIRQKIFAEPNFVAKLNAVLHPIIYQQLLLEIMSAQSVYVVLDVPLLLEGRAKPQSILALCDEVMIVDVPEEVQMARAMMRDGVDLANIEAIMSHQIKRSKRLAIARQNHYDVINNACDLSNLHRQIDGLHQKYCLRALNQAKAK